LAGYQQWTVETGQAFHPEAINLIYGQTHGQPFLVNQLAQLLTQEMGIPRHQPITVEDARGALQRLLRETNNNFRTMLL